MIDIPKTLRSEVKRLRPKHSEEYLLEMYQKPHNHFLFGRDHHLRVDVTTTIAKNTVVVHGLKSGADLSCGSGHIIKNITLDEIYLGDFAPGYELVGPIEETVSQIPEVDIFICSETLEHLDDPFSVLVDIRKKSKSIILSTPIDAFGDPNPEHYWSWSRAGVEWLMAEAGWKIDSFTMLDTTTFGAMYKFGIWSFL